MNNESYNKNKPLILNIVGLPGGDRLIVRRACPPDAEGLTKNIFTAQTVETTLENIKIIRERGWLQVVGQVGDEIVVHVLAMRHDVYTYTGLGWPRLLWRVIGGGEV